MTPERYQQINQLLDAALERVPEERTAWLAAACGDDAELRGEVESLLLACAQAGSFIETPPDDVAAALVAETQARAFGGRTLGHYQLQTLLGAGGMGEVYRARDLRLDREVAVKILPEHLAANAEALRRFEREAKAVAALSHPHILAIHDFGAEQGVNYAVMELLEGETLRARLSRSPLPWREVAEVGVAVAEGLAAAHAKGIIHRDLKPENIFLTVDGQVKILDFGIARVKHTILSDAETAAQTAKTKPGTLLGTIGYMSPEQVRGEEVEAPSDLFAFGCVLYEMLAGARPFARPTTAETLAAILNEEPPELSASDRKVPAELAHIISHCLEKRPERRFQSAHDLAFALKSLLSGREVVLFTRRRAWPQRRFVTWSSVAGLVVLLALAVWFYLSGARAQTIDSLAVLPLVNSGDADAEYLSDGLTESLITSLSQLPQLRVIARSTVFNYKGQPLDPQAVGRKLNVRAVLTGRVTQRGESLSIVAELVRVMDGTQLWGKQFPQRKLADVLAVQTEIAEQISEQLRFTLTGEQRLRVTKPPTENPEAFLLYTRGRWCSANLWTAEGFQKGIAYLNQAIALDPAYALAHAGLASTYYDASSVWLEPKEAMSKAKAEALNALKLDENLAEAHTALALVQSLYEFDWSEAGRHHRRALELNPNFAQAHLYYGVYLVHQGQLAAGLDELHRAQHLDPLTPFTSVMLGFYNYIGRRYDDALVQLQQTRELKPDFYLTHSTLGLVYEQQGKLAEALSEFNEARRCDPAQPFTLGHLGHAYALAGQRGEALQMLAEMRRIAAQGTYVDPVAVAFIYAGLGDKDGAFAEFEQAYQARDENLIHYKDAPLFDGLRADSRFKDLLRRMNLAP